VASVPLHTKRKEKRYMGVMNNLANLKNIGMFKTVATLVNVRKETSEEITMRTVARNECY
jgi:hypothetical protein